jgi:putative sigma-54 modulation protein
VELIFKGRHIDLTPALKDWVQKKLEKIERKLGAIHKIEVELDYFSSKPNERSECEITIYADHAIFRATADNEDMYVAIDKAIEKIERQLEKYKGRVYVSENKHLHGLKHVRSEGRSRPDVVKKKKFELKEITVEQAIDQMEYLDHDFYIFVDSATGYVSVVYRRKDGNVGLIETDVSIL